MAATTQSPKIAESGFTKMRWFQETAYGVLPGSSPAYQEFPFIAETMGVDRPVVPSDNTGTGRRVQDHIVTDLDSSGGFTAEYMLSQFNVMFEAIMGGTIVALVNDPLTSGGAETVAVTNSGESTVWTRAGGTGDWTSVFSVGEWVRETSGVLGTNNSKPRKVSAVTSTVLTTEGSLGEIIGATAGASVDRYNSTIDGNVFRSWHIEKEWAQYTDRFMLYAGQVLNNVRIGLTATGKPTIEFTFIGQTENRATSTAATTTVNPQTKAILSLGSGVELFMIGGSGTNRLVSMNINIDYGAYPFKQGGTEGPVAMGLGRKGVSGSFETYVEEADGLEIMDDYHDKVTSSVAVVLKDPDGIRNVWDIPEILYTNVRANMSGINSPTLVRADWVGQTATEGVGNFLFRYAHTTT